MSLLLMKDRAYSHSSFLGRTCRVNSSKSLRRELNSLGVLAPLIGEWIRCEEDFERWEEMSRFGCDEEER